MAGPGGGGRPKKDSKHYGLTALCPVILGAAAGRNSSHESLIRQALADLPVHEDSPFARVPNTYFARWYLLRDVFYEGRRAREEHLKSQYLVFAADFHGELEPYLREMWRHIEAEISELWQHCVAFDTVKDAKSFVDYIKKCQVSNAYLFNGSTDQTLAEQLKGLFLKQEFGDFVARNQGESDRRLQEKFIQFMKDVQITNLERPTWRPGASSLEKVRVE